jgi:hypothetical protein
VMESRTAVHGQTNSNILTGAANRFFSGSRLRGTSWRTNTRNFKCEITAEIFPAVKQLICFKRMVLNDTESMIMKSSLFIF